MSITIHAYDSQENIGSVVASMIGAIVKKKPNAAIGVATGSSPLCVYKALESEVQNGLDVSQVQWYALDEYIGLSRSHPQSYYQFLKCYLVDPLGIAECNLHVPQGTVEGCQDNAKRYEDEVINAGIDLQILGIGENGHIGFNEPGTSFLSKTHCGTLTESTRHANARFFENEIGEVPYSCITQGLSTIMHARAVRLIATGRTKSRAIHDAVQGQISEKCPASILQMHSDVVFLLDRDAGSEL